MIVEDKEENTEFDTSQEEGTSSSGSNFSNSKILEKFSRASSISNGNSSVDKMEKDN